MAKKEESLAMQLFRVSQRVRTRLLGAEKLNAVNLSKTRAPFDQLKSAGKRMNKKQKTVLIAAIAIVVAMLVFPPFHAVLPAGSVTSLGYSLIFDRPGLDYPYRHLTGTVDIGLLITQWLGVLIVSGIAFLLFKD